MDRDTARCISETIDGWMTTSELEWLFDTAGALAPGATWVELGSWKGRSLFTVAMSLPANSRIVAIDSFSQYVSSLAHIPTTDWVWDHFQVVLNGVRKLRKDLTLSVIRSDTASPSGWFAEESVDVVFFDADHSRAGLESDLDAWTSKVKPGGLLCGHDYNPGFPEVVAVIDERFPEKSIVADTSIWVAKRY